ncbi:5405_t:CDS:2 [Dentiscutata erythropus]|uniref:5405_t:CDS:1 n=1 Tax=Dentiscutata erythropus TaxID=1348616 RepID=A0A9N8VQX7_9GLOM|nr:5405_t:CDS:2 [Dentiscutata erythropus]
MWTVDPVDGTKGFIRRGYFAVGISLIIDGDVHLSVIGCPNLSANYKAPEGEKCKNCIMNLGPLRMDNMCKHCTVARNKAASECISSSIRIEKIEANRRIMIASPKIHNQIDDWG